MRTLYKGKRLSVLAFPRVQMSLGLAFKYSGPGYRYLWTIELMLGRRELTVHWWNPKAARFISEV